MRNVRTLHSDHNTFCVNDHDLTVFIYSFHSNNISGLFSDLVALHTFSSTVLSSKLFHVGTLAHSFFRDNEHIFSLAAHLHSDHNIIVSEVHAPHAHRHSSGRTYICFMESDTLPILSNKKDILLVIRYFYFDKFIVFSEYDRCQTCFSDICIFPDRRFLHKTFFCCHEEVFSFFILIDRYHCRDLFLRHELKQIYDSRAARCPACLRNFISLQAVNSSCICKEHDIVMCSRYKQFTDIIIFQSLHSLDSFSAALLAAEGIHTHPLDISEICHCNYHIFSRDQIFHRNIELIISDMCSSLISVLFRDNEYFLPDHAQKKFFVRKDCFILLDLLHKLCILCFQFFSFQTCQSSQTHINDSLRLRVRKFKPLHQFGFCNLNCL